MVAILKANATGGASSAAPEVTAYKGTVTSVPNNALTTVVSRIVPVATAMKLTGVIATGTVSAEWSIYDDATELYRSRTSPDQRAFQFTHNPISIDTGHTVSLKVVWTESVPGTHTFEGTLLGYDV